MSWVFRVAFFFFFFPYLYSSSATNLSILDQQAFKRFKAHIFTVHQQLDHLAVLDLVPTDALKAEDHVNTLNIFLLPTVLWLKYQVESYFHSNQKINEMKLKYIKYLDEKADLYRRLLVVIKEKDHNKNLDIEHKTLQARYELLKNELAELGQVSSNTN